MIRLMIKPAHLLILMSTAVSLTAAPAKREVDGVVYHVLHAKPEAVRIVWKDASGNQMRTFPEAKHYLERRGESPQVLMNGGIFEPGGIPSGLLVQEGHQLRPINPADGEGNFFLKPNGVFLIGSSGAAIIDSREYPLAGVVVRHAVQSGPLLLRKGKVHSAFNAGSTSRLHRNGVGVTRSGDVVFAMSDIRSEKLPNLHEFAMLFRNLGCDDALFLDGDISQMRSGDDLSRASNPFGSIIAVVRPR